MPNCYQLKKKGSSEASKLTLVDEEICNHLGVSVHPTHWVESWHDIIGEKIAFGSPLGSTDLREDISRLVTKYPESNLMKILDFLEANYVSDAWAEMGRR